YIVNGQKVWTTFGHEGDLGMLIARTNVDVPKHQGISWFACDMHQPGVEVRGLVEMTGHALFNEVFLTDAVVPASALIGDLNNGWAVTNTTLMNERAGLGTGGSGGGGGAAPGTIVGNLPKRAGDFVRKATPKKEKKFTKPGEPVGTAKLLIDIAKGNGTNTDPHIRQGLVKLHVLNELGRFNGLRSKAARAAGRDIAGMANISKLSMSDSMRLGRDLSLQIVGAQGMLHAYKGEAAKDTIIKATGNPFLSGIVGQALWAQGPPIYGGTDQIQRNIIGERVLGLPKEANNDKTAKFSELPKNA
ncbi:MAG: acyl-CoA dehydrogenase, partial [Actinobacteria bacterium]|nr:acyl-CoA dehydrogenase [Actinomycetota bacterium]